MSSQITDRSGNLIARTIQQGPAVSYQDRSGALLGRVQDGKAYDRSGKLLGSADMISTVIPKR